MPNALISARTEDRIARWGAIFLMARQGGAQTGGRSRRMEPCRSFISRRGMSAAADRPFALGRRGHTGKVDVKHSVVQ
jgi:hypothetical protein